MTKTSEKPEAVAPQPGDGFTVVELRTSHQTDIAKATLGNLADAATMGRWVVVSNDNAQAVVDKLIGVGDVGMFTGRVLDFVTAVVLVANPAVTDSRSSLAQRLIGVGRNTDGFSFTMKNDGTLAASVGDTTYPTLRLAMAALAPDQMKAPAKASGASRDHKTASGVSLSDYNAAKAERKALKEWEANGSQGDRPSTTHLDELNGRYEAKQAALAAERAEKAEATKANTAAKKASAPAKKVAAKKAAPVKAARDKATVTPIQKARPRKATS